MSHFALMMIPACCFCLFFMSKTLNGFQSNNMIIPGFTSRLQSVKKKTDCKGLIMTSHLSRGVTI